MFRVFALGVLDGLRGARGANEGSFNDSRVPFRVPLGLKFADTSWLGTVKQSCSTTVLRYMA